MNEPISQHHLPRTYLRRFAIDTKNKSKRSFIYACYFTPINKVKIEIVSTNSTKFKIDHFYTTGHESEPFAFENLLSKHVEPLYNKIMTEIEGEKKLTLKCKAYLIVWLFFNKYRNKSERDNLGRLLNNIIGATTVMKYGKVKFESLKEQIKIESSKNAKQLQLGMLWNDNLFAEFEKGIGTKHWLIFKSRKNSSFITSDNPGFSINVDMGSPNYASLANTYATNYKASNYFPLSPRYCLLISPFWKGTSLDLNLENQEIEFITPNANHQHFINLCTMRCRDKYLLSNEKLILEKYINEVNT